MQLSLLGADFGTQPNPRIWDWAALSTLREKHRIILIEHLLFVRPCLGCSGASAF